MTDAVHKHLIRKTYELTGLRFGSMLVEGLSAERQFGQRLWICKCDCGKTRLFTTGHLNAGRRTSCGDASHKAIHGMANSPEYRAWRGAKSRCRNPRNPKYPIYGGRGITISDDWFNSFETFLSDLGHRPGPEYSLERRDGDKGYNKDNCVWATILEQNNNTKQNTRVDVGGEVMSVANASRLTGIRYRKLLNAVVAHKRATKEEIVCLSSLSI